MYVAHLVAAAITLVVLLVSLAVSLFLMLVVAGPHGMISLPDWLAYIAGVSAWGLPFCLAVFVWRRIRRRQEGRNRR